MNNSASKILEKLRTPILNLTLLGLMKRVWLSTICQHKHGTGGNTLEGGKEGVQNVSVQSLW